MCRRNPKMEIAVSHNTQIITQTDVDTMDLNQIPADNNVTKQGICKYLNRINIISDILIPTKPNEIPTYRDNDKIPKNDFNQIN